MCRAKTTRIAKRHRKNVSEDATRELEALVEMVAKICLELETVGKRVTKIVSLYNTIYIGLES